MTTRREFLRQALPILGFPFLGCRSRTHTPSLPPSWYGDALARMRDEHKFGVLIVLPTDEAERERLSFDLERLIDGDCRNAPAPCATCRAVREILTLAVFGCVEPDAVPSCVGSARPERVLLVDAERRMRDGLSAVPFGDAAAFVAAMEPLLHGRGRMRLALLAEQARVSMSRTESDALDRLWTEDVERLGTIAPRIVPLLVLERMEATEARLDRLRTILDRAFDSGADETPGPRLPYGIRAQASPFPRTEWRLDACHYCGMASSPIRSRRFLGFLR